MAAALVAVVGGPLSLWIMRYTNDEMTMEGVFPPVACGEQHNLARALPGRSSGPSENSQAAALFVWGGGRLGQLGLGSDSTRLAATRNSYMDDVGGGVIGVGAGANHSVCVVASGRVYGWGHAEYNQQGVEVVAGADLMRDHDGFSYFRVPRMIRGLADADIVSVRCGSNFTLAVDNRGVTHSFGWNEGDTLGRGWSGASDPSPGPVLSLPPIVAIAAGSRHGVVVAAEGPGCGRHLSSLLADADSADVELTVPDDARRGIPVHMAVVSARCLYLAGHVQAALKGWEDGVSRQRQGEGEGTSSLPAAELCLEHVTVEIVSLLMRYLYTDELVGDVSGKDLKGLIGLANEMRLPRLESLCVTRLPYYLRRQYTSRNSRTQSSDGTNGSNGSNPEVPPSTLVSEMGTLAGSPRHSDVLLVLPEWGWKFHCHKAILCSAPWWRALLLGGFQEGGKDTMNMTGLLQEGITRSEALEAAVRHVYTNSDDTVVNMDPSSVMEVVILAEYMVLPSLLQACELELTRYVEAESAPFLSSFANKYHLFKLETLCDEILDGSDDGMTELGRSS